MLTLRPPQFLPIFLGGGYDHVIINVKCDNGETYKLATKTDEENFQNKFGVQLPEQMDEKISFLTADPEFSLKIEAVYIKLPNDELTNDLCIIDTPGVNPGADFAEKHAEITKYILNEKADAIIILFPADQAYTQSFEKFLKDNAEYFMKDAIFVVTMMDRVEEEERNDVIQFVKTNLRNNFHLQFSPEVLSCSAILYGKDPYWTNNFKEFEKSLMDKLTQNRQRIVTERLIKLSNELLNSIQSEILSQNTSFENRLTVLQNHSVPNLISVLADSRAAANDELAEIQTTYDTTVQSESAYLENKIMLRVNLGLNLCEARSDVTKYVKNSLASDIEAGCKDIYAISIQHAQNLNKALSSAIEEMIEKLTNYYGEIGSVLPEGFSFSTSEHQVGIKDKFTGINDMLSNYEGNIDIAMTLGGAALASVILAGLGPVGWVVGGIGALVGGDKLFVDSSRNKVREAVSEKIPEISESIVQELCDEMQTNYNMACKALETKEDELVAQYKPVYETLERQFNSEREELMRQIQRSENTLNRIKAVLQQINQIKGEMAV